VTLYMCTWQCVIETNVQWRRELNTLVRIHTVKINDRNAVTIKYRELQQ
jgi:hypothetical protein